MVCAPDTAICTSVALPGPVPPKLHTYCRTAVHGCFMQYFSAGRCVCLKHRRALAAHLCNARCCCECLTLALRK